MSSEALVEEASDVSDLPFRQYRDQKDGPFSDSTGHKFHLKQVRADKKKILRGKNSRMVYFRNKFIKFSVMPGTLVVFDNNSLVRCFATNIEIFIEESPLRSLQSNSFEIYLRRNGTPQLITNKELTYRFYQQGATLKIITHGQSYFRPRPGFRKNKQKAKRK